MKPGFDIVICGAGPAGCTLAIHLASHGLRVAVFDKNRFPRPKICGDALSGKVLNILKRIPGNLYQKFILEIPKTPSSGIRFTSPGRQNLDVPFSLAKEDNSEPSGYLCRREVFDNFLFQELKRYKNISIFENEGVRDVVQYVDYILIKSDLRELTASMIAGADGVHSVVRRKLLKNPGSDTHSCLAVRAYFKNVESDNPQNLIELMFLRQLLPGYFWIFRENDGLFNVGMGMLKSTIKEKRIVLKKLFFKIIENEPSVSARFRNAILTEKPEAHLIPVSDLSFRCTGNRFILLGDAARLVDPFSGEGIGNAMGSAESAVPLILECVRNSDFSAERLKTYELKIKQRFGNEFNTMMLLQNLLKYPFLMDFIVKKANRNESLRNVISGMYSNTNQRRKLGNPVFWVKVLFS